MPKDTWRVVLVPVKVKNKHWQHPGSWLLLVLDYSWATESSLVYHITCPDPLCSSFRKETLRPGVDREPLFCLLVWFTAGTLRPSDDGGVIPDKPPQFTTVFKSFFFICQLQSLQQWQLHWDSWPPVCRVSSITFEVGNSILLLARSWQTPWGAECSASAKPDPPSCNGGKLWPAIVRISCHRKKERGRRGEQNWKERIEQRRR